MYGGRKGQSLKIGKSERIKGMGIVIEVRGEKLGELIITCWSFFLRIANGGRHKVKKIIASTTA